MTRLLLVPALVLAACTDRLPPEQDQITGSATGEHDEAPVEEEPGTDLVLGVGFTHEPNDCTDHSVRLSGQFSYADGTIPENVSCTFALQDGTVILDRCGGTVVLPPPGDVLVFSVTDLDTGVVGTDSGDLVMGPDSFATTLSVSTSGSTLSWDAHTNYGGVIDPGSAGVRISISPSENVIITDPMVLGQLAGSVTVTQPGTYTVTADGVIQFGEVGGCGAQAVQTIHVACDDPMHDDAH